MPRFFRPWGVPEFVTPPSEPSRYELPPAADVAAIDAKLREQALRPKNLRNYGLIDVLLAERSAATRAASVPVIPGRS